MSTTLARPLAGDAALTRGWTGEVVRRTLAAGGVLIAPIVLIATVAVAAVPHARGLGFVPELRYAVLTPIVAICTVAAAFLYRFLQHQRPERVKTMFRVSVLGVACFCCAAIAVGGRAGFALAAVPVILTIALALALLVPRTVDRPRRPVPSAIATVFGAIAIAGVFAARAGEGPARAATDGLAFDLPRAVFDTDPKFVEIDGARVHYVDVGSGETLLFLHGNPAWSFQWRELIRGMRGAYRCVALDYPGFGLSTAAAGYGYTAREQSRLLEAFVDRLGLRDVTLVMQDWGGPIGLGLAGRRPDLVRRVILGNTWAWPTETGEARGMFSKIVGGPIGEFAQMNFNGFVQAAIAHDLDLPPDTLDLYQRPFRTLDGRRVAAFYPGQITAATGYFREVEAGLGTLRDRRALILWGMRDPGFPRADLERFERAFPNHRTVELPEAGHFFFEGDPARVVREMTAFLSEPDTTATARR